MHREPDVGFDPGSPGSRPGPKAGAKPLRHPGIPIPSLLEKEEIYKKLKRSLYANESGLRRESLEYFKDNVVT